MPSDINSIQAWCAVISTIVTLIASYFVVQTFSMQAKVMMEQSQITKLEIERSILERNPVFAAEMVKNTYSVPDGSSGNTHEISIYNLTFTLLRNDIYWLKTDVHYHSGIAEEHMALVGLESEIAFGIIEGSKLECFYYVEEETLGNLIRDGNYDSLSFKITFQYRNLVGVSYIQTVHVNYAQQPLAESPFARRKMEQTT